MRGNYILKVNKEDIIFLLTVNNNSKNKELTHLTTKMVVVNNSVENSLSNIAELSGYMGLDQLYVFCIDMNETSEYKVAEVGQVKYIELSVKLFANNYLDNPNNTDFWNYNKNSLYILRNGDYSDIKNLFTIIQQEKVNTVRGSSQKSHMVSPIDFRLSCYMLILCNMNYKKFNMENAFNTVTKDRYLPSLG